MPGSHSLRRLASGWTMPKAPPALAWIAASETAHAPDDIEYSRVGRAARNLVARLPGHRVVVPALTLGERHRILVGTAGNAPTQARAVILRWADAFDVADSTFDALRAALDLAADHKMPI